MNGAELPTLAVVLHPPVETIGKRLEHGAKLIARLLTRRNHHLAKAEQLDGELVRARVYLRALIREAQLAPPRPVQLDVEEDL
jgi:hypothetical protein